MHQGLQSVEKWAVGGSTLGNFDALEALWHKTHSRVHPWPRLAKSRYFTSLATIKDHFVNIWPKKLGN